MANDPRLMVRGERLLSLGKRAGMDGSAMRSGGMVDALSIVLMELFLALGLADQIGCRGGEFGLAQQKGSRRLTGAVEPRNEGGVLGGGTAQVNYHPDSPRITSQECVGIEPKSRKHGRTVQAITSGRSPHQRSLLLAKPINLIGFDRTHDIFQHSGPLVVVQLRSKIDVSCRLGDLDDEFRCTRDIALFDMTPTATFGQHA
jgi:hypothetical protein